MDRNLARRRGLGPVKAAKAKPEDIGFFDSVEELTDELLNHGWSITASKDGWLCWTLEGCDTQVHVDGRFERVKLVDTDSEYETEGRLSECFMIAGSLFVGSSVEL